MADEETYTHINPDILFALDALALAAQVAVGARVRGANADDDSEYLDRRKRIDKRKAKKERGRFEAASILDNQGEKDIETLLGFIEGNGNKGLPAEDNMATVNKKSGKKTKKKSKPKDANNGSSDTKSEEHGNNACLQPSSTSTASVPTEALEIYPNSNGRTEESEVSEVQPTNRESPVYQASGHSGGGDAPGIQVAACSEDTKVSVPVSQPSSSEHINYALPKPIYARPNLEDSQNQSILGGRLDYNATSTSSVPNVEQHKWSPLKSTIQNWSQPNYGDNEDEQQFLNQNAADESDEWTVNIRSDRRAAKKKLVKREGKSADVVKSGDGFLTKLDSAFYRAIDTHVKSRHYVDREEACFPAFEKECDFTTYVKNITCEALEKSNPIWRGDHKETSTTRASYQYDAHRRIGVSSDGRRLNEVRVVMQEAEEAYQKLITVYPYDRNYRKGDRAIHY